MQSRGTTATATAALTAYDVHCICEGSAKTRAVIFVGSDRRSRRAGRLSQHTDTGEAVVCEFELGFARADVVVFLVAVEDAEELALAGQHEHNLRLGILEDVVGRS